MNSERIRSWTLKDMMERVSTEPKLIMQYPGIKEKSVGIIFGPPKSAKTIYCENLGMAIAAGQKSYLGQPLNVANKLVQFISFEEHYAQRTERNCAQAAALSKLYGEEWQANYRIVDDKMPRYIIGSEDWERLRDLINSVRPGMVFLDSLTRMYSGSIEDSNVAIQLTRKLRQLSEDTGTTIAAIHHTHKMYGQPLSIDTIAGSRVIAQEMDFMIGLNRTPAGNRYIKNVAFRYAACDDETVRTFKIGNDYWLEIMGGMEERELLSAQDGRKDDTNMNRILELLMQQKGAGVDVVVTADIQKALVPHVMTRQTMFTNLLKLVKEGRIQKSIGKGGYAILS